MAAFPHRCVLMLCVITRFGSIASQFVCPIGTQPGQNDTCEPCPPGTAGGGNEELCFSCPYGTFQSLAGQASCLPCPPGARSEFGATMCASCPEGQGVTQDGTCHVCQPGEELFRITCSPCFQGFFKAEEGPGPCLPCPPGSFSRFGKTVECTTCPKDQAPVMPDGNCGQCPPGTYYQEAFFNCLECSPGTFTNIFNVMEECFSCGGNSFASIGATECIPCPIGQVFIKSTKSCEDECGPGFFYNEFGLECLPCRFNQFSSGGQRLCEDCREGSFSRMGSSTCFTCPSGESFLADMDACGVCPEEAPYDSSSALCGISFLEANFPPPEA